MVLDTDLVRRAQGGDSRAFDALVTKYRGRIYSMTYHLVQNETDAWDLSQEAFIKAWRALPQFKLDASFYTWIYRIAHNLAIDHWRSRRSRDEGREPVRFHLVRAAEGVDTSALGELKEAEVERIFRELALDLTEKQRLIYILREIEGMPSNEVAEIAGCEESTVRNHLFNARKILRERLIERYPEYASRARSTSSGETR